MKRNQILTALFVLIAMFLFSACDPEPPAPPVEEETPEVIVKRLRQSIGLAPDAVSKNMTTWGYTCTVEPTVIKAYKGIPLIQPATYTLHFTDRACVDATYYRFEFASKAEVITMIEQMTPSIISHGGGYQSGYFSAAATQDDHNFTTRAEFLNYYNQHKNSYWEVKERWEKAQYRLYSFPLQYNLEVTFYK